MSEEIISAASGRTLSWREGWSIITKRYCTHQNVRRAAWVIIVFASLSLIFNLLKLSILKETYLLDGYSSWYISVISLAPIIVAVTALVGGYGIYNYKEWGRQTIIVWLLAYFVIFIINDWQAMQLRQPYIPLLAPTALLFLLLYLLSRPKMLEIFS